jgi:hypothetical protein
VAGHAVQGRLLAAGELPPKLLIHAGMKPYFERSGLGERDMVVLPNPVVPYCGQRVQAEANRDVLFVGSPLAPALVAHGPHHALHLGVELPLALLEQQPDVLCAS